MSLKDILGERFGETPEYDPIELSDRSDRRADNIMEGIPSSSPATEQTGIPSFLKRGHTSAPAEQQGFLGNQMDLLKAGTVQVGEMALGAGEYATRHNKYLTGLTPYVERARGSLAETREGILDQINPEYLAHVGGELLTLDPDKTIWKGNPLEVGAAVLGKFTQAIPASVVTMLPAIRLFKAGATAGALTYLGASEGTMSVGGIQNNIVDEIGAMSHEELLNESQMYQQIYGSTQDEGAARTELIRKAQGAAPLVGGITVAAISMVGGKYLQPIFEKTGGAKWASRVGRGAMAEFPAEGTQGAAEQVTQNLAAQAYDEDRRLSEGVAEAFAQEGLVGGLMGGAFAGAAGQRPDRPTPPLPDPTEDPGGQMNLPGFGPTQKEEGFGIEPEGYRDPEPGFAPGVIYNEQQQDMFPTSDSTEFTRPMQSADSPTGVPEQGVLPMTLKERGKPLLQENPRGARLPDQLDQPTAEPVEDLQAQIEDMKGANGRSGVYVSPEQRNMNVKLPKGAVTIPNFDGKGGVLIAKDQAAATYARKRRAEGGSMQAIIGEVTLAGTGKPNVKAGHVVQLVDENGAVSRETLVATKSEANSKKKEWGPNARIVSGPDALARRSDLLEKEQIDLSQDQAAVTERNDDMFADQSNPQPLTAAENRSGTDGYVTRLFDQQNNLIDEQLLATQEEADALADQHYTDFPDGNVTVQPSRTQPVPAKASLSTVQQAKADAKNEPVKTAQEETAASLRSTLTFDERNEIPGVMESESTSEAAKKLASEAATARTSEDRKRIDGFRSPDELTFNDSFQEDEYRAAWSDLVDASVAGEMATTARNKASAEKKRQVARKRLSTARQLDKPVRTKQRSDRLAASALKADRSITRTQQANESKNKQADDTFEEDTVGELEDMTPEQIDKLVDRDAKGNPIETQRLNVVAEQALRSRVGRNSDVTFDKEREFGEPVSPEDVASNDRITYEAYKAQYNTPGRKLKLIRREVLSKQKRDRKQTKVKDTKVTTAAAVRRGTDQARATKDVGTKPLVVDKRKQDESVSDRTKRREKAKAVRSALRATVRKAKGFINRFGTQGDFGTYAAEQTDENGKLSKLGADFLYGKMYYQQIVQFAESLITTEHRSLDTIELMEGIDKMLGALDGITVEGFTKGWSKLARANEFEQLGQISDKEIRAMSRTPSKRAKDTKKSNSKVLNNIKRMYRMENLWATDPIWQEFVGPVLRKFSEVVQQNQNQPVGDAYYQPTAQEVHGLAMALRAYRKTPDSKYETEFYKPLREALRYLGFKFDAKGDLMTDGYSPSDEVLSPRFNAKKGGKVGKGEVSNVVPTRDAVVEDTPAAQRAANQDVMDQRKAAVVITQVNRQIARFKDKISNSKVTITGIIRAEQRFVRALRSIGAWTDGAKNMGRITALGYGSKTIRLVGDRLKNKTMRKPAARAYIEKIRELPIPRDLKTVASTLDLDTIGATARSEETDFFLENVIRLDETSVELDQAASAVGDLLSDRYSQPDANKILDTLIAGLPNGHFYHRLAQKLRAMNMADTTLQYDWAGVKFNDNAALGKYDPNENRAYLNREAMQEIGLQGSNVLGARAVHTALHEFMHAATHKAIAESPALQKQFFEMRAAALAAWQRSDGKGEVPYGLRALKADGTPYPIDEFVAEFFANEEIQEFAKTVPFENTNKTLWRKFVDALKRIFSMEDTANVDSIFDAMMSVEEDLFSGAGQSREGIELMMLDKMDEPLRKVASAVLEKVGQSSSIFQRVKEGAANAGRYVMTMEQLRDTYEKHFNTEKGNPLRNYMDAFFQRNARNAELMEVPEKVSRNWTKLEESEPEQATELSQVGSHATLSQITADQSIDHESNSHLTSDEQKALHADLHARYNALSPAAKKVWADTQKYYSDSVENESLQLLRSALRGILTKGKGINLTLADFEGKFSLDALAAIETKEDLAKLLEEYVPEEGRDEMIETLHKMATVPRQRKGNYFPAMRYGENVVFAEKKHDEKIYEDRKEAWEARTQIAATDPTLDVGVYKNADGKWVLQVVEREFVMAETKAHAEKKRDELVERYGEGNVGAVQQKISKEADAQINSNAALQSILGTLDGNAAAQAAIKNFYLRSLAESSFRKHEMQRKNRRGINYDEQHRNLANYAKQSSYYTAQLEFGWKMSEALNDMRDYVKGRPDEPGMSTNNMSEVVKQVQYRDEMSTDPAAVNKAVRKGVELTHFMMLTSPSYWAINATQPWLVSVPQMAGRHGYGQTLSAMGLAQKLIKAPLITAAKDSRGGLIWSKSKVEDAFDVVDQLKEHIKNNGGENSERYMTLLERLRQDHIIDINVFTELREIATAESTTTAARVIDASRIMAHLTEVNNRVLTAIAAYQLEYNKAIADGASIDSAVEQATVYAGNMVSQTQFNYSSANKPPLFQSGGPLGFAAPLMFQFMQWPQHMYALMIRNFNGAVGKGAMSKEEARKSLLGLFATHAAVGGVVGMALQPIKWAIGLTMMAFGDDDEPYTFANAVSGRTFDRIIADTSTDLFGTTLGTVVTKGLPMAVGIDLSARMSMGTLYFIDMRGDTAQSALGSLVASFGGATLNQAVNFGRGLGKIGDGDVYRGIEAMMPKISRDAMRALRYYNEGLVNNAGDTVIPASEMGINDIIAQSIGFSPSQVSQFYTSQNAIKDAETYATGRKEDILKRFRSGEDRPGVLSEVRDFNSSFPAERITRSALISSLRTKRKREARFRRFGANIDERKAAAYEKYGRAYQDDE